MSVCIFFAALLVRLGVERFVLYSSAYVFSLPSISSLQAIRRTYEDDSDYYLFVERHADLGKRKAESRIYN